MAVRPRVTLSPSALYERREQLQADYKWLLEQKSVLSHDPKFLNKFVAVKDKKVVFFEKDPDCLKRKIRATKESPDTYVVDYISQQSTCFLL